MHNIVRIILLLGIAGSAMTLLASSVAWWMEEGRRLRRISRRVLGGEPDGMIIAQGRNCAAALRLGADQALVMRQGGAAALLYPLRMLMGAELIVDGEVVARASRGEPRKALDKIASEARRVTLRLVFDDAAHPDFDLDLWEPEDALRRGARPPATVIAEARGWLARADAILRRAPDPRPPAVVAPAPCVEPEPVRAGPSSPSPAPAPAPAEPPEEEDKDGQELPPLTEPIQPYLL